MLSVCRITRKPHDQTFVPAACVAAARSFSGGAAICYVLPVLWMTLCLHIMAGVGDARRTYTRSESPGSSSSSFLPIRILHVYSYLSMPSLLVAITFISFLVSS